MWLGSGRHRFRSEIWWSPVSTARRSVGIIFGQAHIERDDCGVADQVVGPACGHASCREPGPPLCGTPPPMTLSR